MHHRESALRAPHHEPREHPRHQPPSPEEMLIEKTRVAARAPKLVETASENLKISAVMEKIGPMSTLAIDSLRPLRHLEKGTASSISAFAAEMKKLSELITEPSLAERERARAETLFHEAREQAQEHVARLSQLLAQRDNYAKGILGGIRGFLFAGRKRQATKEAAEAGAAPKLIELWHTVLNTNRAQALEIEKFTRSQPKPKPEVTRQLKLSIARPDASREPAPMSIAVRADETERSSAEQMVTNLQTWFGDRWNLLTTPERQAVIRNRGILDRFSEAVARIKIENEDADEELIQFTVCDEAAKLVVPLSSRQTPRLVEALKKLAGGISNLPTVPSDAPLKTSSSAP